MKKKMRSKHKPNWILRIVVVACIIFALVKTVQLQSQINEKQKEIDRLSEEITKATLINEDLDGQSKDYQSYLEQHLREEGYVYPNDQIYQFSK